MNVGRWNTPIRLGAVLLVLAAVAALVYVVCVMQGNMVFEQLGGDTYQWTPLEAGAFYATGILGALGVVLVGVGLAIRRHPTQIRPATV